MPKESKKSSTKSSSSSAKETTPTRPRQGDFKHKDNSFREFRRLCARIAQEASYNAKTEAVERYLSKGSDGNQFRGDLYVWTRLLLPGVVKRIYNLQSKQLVKIFAR